MSNCLPSSVSCLNSSPKEENGAELLAADFSARLVALVIDLLVLTFVSLCLNFLAGYQIFNAIEGDIQRIFDLSVFGFILFFSCPYLLSMIYFTLLHGIGGRTIGKSLMGLKVVSRSGGELGFGLSFIRWMGYQISFVPMCAGFLWVVLDLEKRAWHDILASSKVVYDKKYVKNS